MNLAPIVLFVYNRPLHAKQTLQALSENHLAKDSIIYIYSDGARISASREEYEKINETRIIIKSQQWCKKVHLIEAPINIGLANSIINGVTEVINKHGKAIVLEDDLVTSKYFLQYMNSSLEKYENDNEIMQISGHQFPIKNWDHKQGSFFLPLTTSWGWATWQRAWNNFDGLAKGYEVLKTDDNLRYKFNVDDSYECSSMLITQMESNKISSWAIRWWWTVFKMNGLVLFPDKSLVKNIGWDGSGRHAGKNDSIQDEYWDRNYEILKFPVKIEPDTDRLDLLKAHLKKRTFIVKPSFIIRIINRLRKKSS